MPNMTITNVDLGSVIWDGAIHEDNLLSFAGEATYAEGTLLARRSSSADSYTGTPTGTGNRATTLTALPGRSLQAGAYTLTYGDVTAGAGPATLVGPSGVPQQIAVTASGNQDFAVLGVRVAIAGSGTAYDDGDTVVFTVVSGGSVMVPFAPTGVNGAQVPVAVLTAPASRSTAGTLAARPLVGGEVRRERLVIHGGGSVTQAHCDALRDVGIFALSTPDLSVLDNQ